MVLEGLNHLLKLNLKYGSSKTSQGGIFARLSNDKDCITLVNCCLNCKTTGSLVLQLMFKHIDQGEAENQIRSKKSEIETRGFLTYIQYF